MRKKGLWLCGILLLLAACDDGGERKARAYLRMAEEAFAAGAFSEAKMQIDSIRVLYPKAFEARREGIALMQRVELEEQRVSLVFLDSLLRVRQADFEAVKGKFAFEKDTAYQEVGNYFHPSQTVEKNVGRTFLRAQVDEHGQMLLSSIYRGSHPIHHHAVRVSADDGSFAETPRTDDVYETSYLGVLQEQADYKLGEDGDVIGFISLHKGDRIKAEFLGKRKYVVYLPAADREAISEVYSLAQLLSAIDGIKKQMAEARLKMEFITRKMAEKEATGG